MGYTDLFSLEGRKAVVTGGCGYLGAETVKGLADFDAEVVVLCRKKREIEGLTKPVTYIECDLTDTEHLKAALKKAAGEKKTIDILLLMAADRGAGVLNDIENMGDDYWSGAMDNTAGITFRTIREAIPYMKNSTCGSIITIGSLYAVIAPDPRTYSDTPFSSTPSYGAGKAATLELTKYCAAYLAKYGIRVNCLGPGSCPHPAVQENELFKKRLAEKTMLGRIGYPEDLVGATVFLASDASKFVTGINLMVDGGQTAW